MPLAQSTPDSWTWTVVQAENVPLPDYYHLSRSAQGELLLQKGLVGKRFIIWYEDVKRGFSAEPGPQFIQEAGSLLQVQVGPRHYTAAYRLPNGGPNCRLHLPPSTSPRKKPMVPGASSLNLRKPTANPGIPKSPRPKMTTMRKQKKHKMHRNNSKPQKRKINRSNQSPQLPIMAMKPALR